MFFIFEMLYFFATEKDTHFKLYHHKNKMRISNKQNFENEAFKVGFVLLKIKLTETKSFNNQWYTRSAESFQLLKAV